MRAHLRWTPGNASNTESRERTWLAVLAAVCTLFLVAPRVAEGQSWTHWTNPNDPDDACPVWYRQSQDDLEPHTNGSADGSSWCSGRAGATPSGVVGSNGWCQFGDQQSPTGGQYGNVECNTVANGQGLCVATLNCIDGNGQIYVIGSSGVRVDARIRPDGTGEIYRGGQQMSSCRVY